MKRFDLTSVLAAALILSVAAALGLTIRYARLTRAGQRLTVATQHLQASYLYVERLRGLMQALGHDAIQYSKHNRAMAVLLQPYATNLAHLNLKVPPLPTGSH